MPFPPTFDHVWDLTQPPDTQLLNQGALDFRSLKDDVMQRMSLLSGTLANRPVPETVNATWGGVGFGLIYFASDTGQIFQWNGAVWTDLTTLFLLAPRHFSDLTEAIVNAPGVTTTLNTVVVPASFGANSVAKIFSTGTSNTGTPTISVSVNGTSVLLVAGISGGLQAFVLNLTLLGLSPTLLSVQGYLAWWPAATGAPVGRSVFGINVAYTSGIAFNVIDQVNAGPWNITSSGMSAFLT
jgi:hypothetical protein